MSIELIALAQLRVSTSNVRKDNATEIDTLVASIRAIGLQQNLIVTPNCEGFEVVGGGRRLRALQALAKDGYLAEDHQVPCMVVDGEAALEASTAENFVRLPMHPADQYDAFQELATAGRGPAEIATRFGISERHVRQMLRLAGVSPKILELYRGDSIELNQVMALAIVDDHDLQERTWERLSKNRWGCDPEDIRRELTPKEVPHDSELGRFVSLKAYRAAGGHVREDMFSDLQLMVDRGLVVELAMAKLQAKADKLMAEGWSWAEAHLEWNYSFQGRYQLTEQIHSWKKPSKDELDTYKPWCGCVVTVDPSGKPKVIYGLSRKGAKPPANGADGDAGQEKAKRDPALLSFAQTQALQGELSAILRNQLAQQPRVALAALAASLAGHQLHRWQRALDGAMRLAIDRDTMPPIARDAAADSPAGRAAAERVQALLDRLSAVKGPIFEWLLEQPEAVTHEVLAVIGTSSINVVQFSATDSELGPKFAAIAGIDVAEHWSIAPPEGGTKPAWLSGQPKGYILSAVREACGKTAAEGIAGLKKAEAAIKATALIVEAQDKGKGKRWLPKPLRATKAKPKAETHGARQ